MTTIVANLIFSKDHIFPTVRQIDPKLGGRDQGNMNTQNCSNNSILIANMAPMATILIFSKRHNFPKHMSDYTERLGRYCGNMGIETSLNF